VSNSGFRPLYHSPQFTTHASNDTFEKIELRDGFSRGPYPAIVLPAATARTKSAPNTAKYTGIPRYFRLLTLSNPFIVDSRRVDGERVKMALYR
jgi:hypothetical protein